MANASRDFRDHGTGRFFEKGKPVDVDEGTLDNYRLGGMIEGEATVAEQPVPVPSQPAIAATEAVPAPTKPARKRATKSSA